MDKHLRKGNVIEHQRLYLLDYNYECSSHLDNIDMCRDKTTIANYCYIMKVKHKPS